MPVYTLQDIDSRVLSRLDNNTALYDSRQRYYAINESLKCINLFSPFATNSVDVPGFSVAGQQFYPCPAGFIFPLRVYWNSRQLQKLSMRAMSMKYRAWASTYSSQGMPVQEWIPCGLGLFGLHPIPSAGGQQITVNGVVEPTPLVNPTDIVVIEDQFIELCEELAASVLPIKESTAIFSQSSMIYNKFQGDMRKHIRWSTYKFQRYYLIGEQIKGQPQDQNDQQAAA